MKLVIAVVQNKDSAKLRLSLIKRHIKVTKLSTTGGFLKSGNTTYLIGIHDQQLSGLIRLIKNVSQSRRQSMTPPVNLDGGAHNTAYPINVKIGGATVMVLPMEHFYRF